MHEGLVAQSTFATATSNDRDSASLELACRGIDVVVSAVQGLRDTIVDGQTRLLHAAEKAGVTRRCAARRS
jgi:hypothetical protein